MLFKLWATYEMNFWERKIQGALECNLTVKRFGVTYINFQTML